MKQRAEIMTENAVKVLLQTLERNFNDTGIVLDQYEATHDDCECCNSKAYKALVAGHLALKDAIAKINRILNKPNK
ncbi:hypothetical protein [uncultured Muribaculum sp.]|uniref:hypothetical protein n=1 Tax=uncultured Muribaculum sp. TaxID=1918613 RepID=UPI002624F6CB|nr:hypothetical protein [uncultured Muribaculum sp.]